MTFVVAVFALLFCGICLMFYSAYLRGERLARTHNVRTVVAATVTALSATYGATISPDSYLTRLAPQTPGLEESGPTGKITADHLNVRAGPDTNYNVIGKLVAGQKVRLSGRNLEGTWLLVYLPDGRQGWISARYVEIKEITSTLASLKTIEHFTPLPRSQPTPTIYP
ncbi:MAG: SH3 domain-containing protein [Anaerolineae bacterium]